MFPGVAVINNCYWRRVYLGRLAPRAGRAGRAPMPAARLRAMSASRPRRGGAAVVSAGWASVSASASLFSALASSSTDSVGFFGGSVVA